MKGERRMRNLVSSCVVALLSSIILYSCDLLPLAKTHTLNLPEVRDLVKHWADNERVRKEELLYSYLRHPAYDG